MSRVEKILRRQAPWERERATLSWSRKLRMSVILRNAQWKLRKKPWPEEKKDNSAQSAVKKLTTDDTDITDKIRRISAFICAIYESTLLKSNHVIRARMTKWPIDINQTLPPPLQLRKPGCGWRHGDALRPCSRKFDGILSGIVPHLMPWGTSRMLLKPAVGRTAQKNTRDWLSSRGTLWKPECDWIISGSAWGTGFLRGKSLGILFYRRSGFAAMGWT